jgi:hypothetical protein
MSNNQTTNTNPNQERRIKIMSYPEFLCDPVAVMSQPTIKPVRKLAEGLAEAMQIIEFQLNELKARAKYTELDKSDLELLRTLSTIVVAECETLQATISEWA